MFVIYTALDKSVCKQKHRTPPFEQAMMQRPEAAGLNHAATVGQVCEYQSHVMRGRDPGCWRAGVLQGGSNQSMLAIPQQVVPLSDLAGRGSMSSMLET